MRMVQFLRLRPRVLAPVAAAVVLVGVIAAQSDEPSGLESAGPSETAFPTYAVPTPRSAGITPSKITAPSRVVTTPSRPSGPVGSSPALAALATIVVKGRAPRTGYERGLFGSAWTDDNDAVAGHNGCDTRNDILRRDLTDVVLKVNSNGCSVLTGRLHDPYSGNDIQFVRGPDSAVVQIDHVVALSNAWQTGAQQLDERTRISLANDPLNLLAVDGPTNQNKSDGDAATWLPPEKSYRCDYVARQVAVKARYRLWMTRAERDASSRVLARCPGQKLPIAVAIPLGGAPVAEQSTSAPTTSPATGALPGRSVNYANCAAVRAAGAAPLHIGQPGYSHSLDRDGDGVACEL